MARQSHELETDSKQEPTISPQELGVFRLIAEEGLTNVAIAGRLNISPAKVRKLIESTNKKTGTNGREDGMLSLLANGQIPLPPLEEPYSPHPDDILTAREIGLLTNMTRLGRQTNKRVGLDLGLEKETIRNEFGIIMDKLGIHCRALVLVRVIQAGLVPMPERNLPAANPGRMDREHILIT